MHFPVIAFAASATKQCTQRSCRASTVPTRAYQAAKLLLFRKHVRPYISLGTDPTAFQGTGVVPYSTPIIKRDVGIRCLQGNRHLQYADCAICSSAMHRMCQGARSSVPTREAINSGCDRRARLRTGVSEAEQADVAPPWPPSIPTPSR